MSSVYALTERSRLAGDTVSIETADNEAVVHREIRDVWDGGDFDVIPDLVAEDFVFHNPMLDEPARGPDGYRKLVEAFHDSFSDMEHEVDGMYAVDDVVVTRYTTRATHDGELMGIAPTETKIEVTGIVIDHLKGGKLAERYVNDDALGLFEQIGAVEPPTESEPTD